ncbi:leucyl aminopeptidase [Thermocatellispora tengchongensis]|uniref:Probable cytosol aminopeptidase n=1 Tax=Thermocatellispora tengchongensis TaxID=1073253 RepID=A0A840P4Z8_9ACTN|nr:M17 family metallopeptidase [Thermocatellispora tengchongensis]MBB5132941.1 leucyl aminopeptidase [Thermocatellispora tengchongensis]
MRVETGPRRAGVPEVRGVFAGEAPDLPWGGFAGAAGETAAAYEGGAPVLLAGLGPERELDAEALRTAATAAARAVPEVQTDLAARAAARLGPAESVRATVTGLALAETPPSLVTLTGCGDEAKAIKAAEATEAAERTEAAEATESAEAIQAAIEAGLLDAEAVLLARDLINRPPGDLIPSRLAEEAHDAAVRGGLDARVLDEHALRELGMGALLGMGAGSPHPPRLVDLRYEPPGARASVTLVGKGITFDSGGLSLKSPAAMMAMRGDMTGAAVVLGVMAVLARRGLPVAVRGLLPLAENMIGPYGVRPGDVLAACDGRRIQVLDTDFEGRVILADALALAARDRPGAIVDVATLTYQVVTALGPDIGGVLGRDPALTERVLAAGAAAGEPLWPLPWARRYRDQISSPYAEVRNFPEADTGRAITAALLLGEFVPEEIPFAHLDITGPSWRGPASGRGATGFGVLTLTRLLEAFARGA